MVQKLSIQWEKRNTLLKKSKVRFAVLSALMKIIAKPKTKAQKKDIQSIAKIIGTHCYKAFPTKAHRTISMASMQSLIGTVLLVNNDVLYSFGLGYFFVVCEISENGYKRFFDKLKSKQYNGINETIAFQKQDLNESGENFISSSQALGMLNRLDDTLNNFDSYYTSEHSVERINVNKALNFIANNTDAPLTVIGSDVNVIDNLYFVNLLKMYLSLGIEEISIKYPIRRLNDRITILSGIDANGYILRCGIMPKEKGALGGYSVGGYGVGRNSNKWVSVTDVIYFDGNWSVVSPKSLD